MKLFFFTDLFDNVSVRFEMKNENDKFCILYSE